MTCFVSLKSEASNVQTKVETLQNIQQEYRHFIAMFAFIIQMLPLFIFTNDVKLYIEQDVTVRPIKLV